MVRLYTNKKYVAPKEVVTDQVNFFKVVVGSQNIDADGLYCMKEIDKAELLDSKLGTIQTPFGVTDIGNLSTGCLTALNMLYIKKSGKQLAVDITLCGENALNMLFDYACLEVPLILRHCKLNGCVDRDFLVNDLHTASNRHVLSALIEDCLREDAANGI